MTTADNPMLSDLIDRSKHIMQDAYRAGYRDGYQAAMSVLMDAAKAAAGFPIDETQASASLGTEGVNQNAADAIPAGFKTVSLPIPQTISGRAAPGSIKNLVRTFVLSAGTPVSEAEFARRYPDVLRPSRYMAFRTLRQEGVIVKENGKWFPAPVGAAKSDALVSEASDNLSSQGDSSDA